jgi:hypothetical protein
MIVMIGPVAFRPSLPAGGEVVGLAGEAAIAAAAAGASVELLAKVGEDGAGEELLLAIARGGVGHLAVLRDAGRPTALAPVPDAPGSDGVDAAIGDLVASADPVEPAPDGSGAVPPGLALEAADLSLGLRYLREYGVVVVVEPLAEGGPAVVADAASFADAALVVIAAPGAPLPGAYAAATVLEAPSDDPDGVFAALVGRFAAALDRGEPAADALRAAAAAGGWEAAEG